MFIWLFEISQAAYFGVGGTQQMLQLVPVPSPSLAILGQERNSNSSSAAWAFCELPCVEVKLLGAWCRYLNVNV